MDPGRERAPAEAELPRRGPHGDADAEQTFAPTPVSTCSRSNDTPTAALEAAPGSRCCCLQHFTGTLDNWDPAVTDPLAAGREVILFESAGIGRSTGRSRIDRGHGQPRAGIWTVGTVQLRRARVFTGRDGRSADGPRSSVGFSPNDLRGPPLGRGGHHAPREAEPRAAPRRSDPSGLRESCRSSSSRRRNPSQAAGEDS